LNDKGKIMKIIKTATLCCFCFGMFLHGTAFASEKKALRRFKWVEHIAC